MGVALYLVPEGKLGGEHEDVVKAAIVAVVALIVALALIQGGLLIPYVQRLFVVTVDHAGRLLGV